jgi:hypothetical protein
MTPISTHPTEEADKTYEAAIWGSSSSSDHNHQHHYDDSNQSLLSPTNYAVQITGFGPSPTLPRPNPELQNLNEQQHAMDTTPSQAESYILPHMNVQLAQEYEIRSQLHSEHSSLSYRQQHNHQQQQNPSTPSDHTETDNKFNLHVLADAASGNYVDL